MRLLLDQCTPLGLARLIHGHKVVRAAAMGWAELSNGSLLEAAEQAGFDVLITSDRNIRYQQNLTTRTIALLVLSTNNWPVIRAGVALIVQAIEAMPPAGYRELEFPRPALQRNPPPGRTNDDA